MDITDVATRSRMMAAISGRDTEPELFVRKALWARGFRYRLQDKGLPGKPDLVLPKHRAVVFVHGCFWHQHGCSNSRRPRSRVEFWNAKLDRNVQRDTENVEALVNLGWRVGIVWECSIRREKKSGGTTVIDNLSTWLFSRAPESSHFSASGATISFRKSC